MKILAQLICLMNFCVCFSQRTFECGLKTYLNDNNTNIGKIDFVIITHKDTLRAVVENNRIIFPNVKENFYLEMHFENEVMKVGAYRPADFQNSSNIIVGKVNNIDELTKIKNYSDRFMIANTYPLLIVNPQQVGELVYCMIQRSVTNLEGRDLMSIKQYAKQTKVKN